MQELNDEYCEVLEAVGIDCNSHRLNAGLGPKLDLVTNRGGVLQRIFKINFWGIKSKVQTETCHQR